MKTLTEQRVKRTQKDYSLSFELAVEHGFISKTDAIISLAKRGKKQQTTFVDWSGLADKNIIFGEQIDKSPKSSLGLLSSILNASH